MIKVSVNKCTVKVHEMNGNAIEIMSELCLIVEAVCSAWTCDEDNAKELQSIMVDEVAVALANRHSWKHTEQIDEDTDN